MIRTGKAQVHPGFLHDLLAEGVPEDDARELARLDAFGKEPVQPWLAGLRATAVLMNGGQIRLDWGTLPDPWNGIGPTLASATNGNLSEALIQGLGTYELGLQGALITTLGLATVKVAQEGNHPRHIKVIAPIAGNSTEQIEQVAKYLKPIEPKFTKQILTLLHGNKGQKEQRRKRAGEKLLNWLLKNGKFLHTTYGYKYYLYRATHKLYSLNTDAWHAWLYVLTGVNPASTDFRYLLADCQAVAEESEELEVLRLAHWDQHQQVLRVSRFDGQVYRLDGQTWEIEANGDGPVLFDDASYWVPYEPDFTGQGRILQWSMNDLPHWDGDRQQLGLIHACWWLATFFTELCPTRPILVAKGEKGSGKSMMLRIIMRLLFGPAVDVVGVPERSDAFISLTSNNHIVVLDNLDTVVREIRDKIASLSTGKNDQLRRLYTTNETQIIRYRCWLAITSRTPDTLQRDDLVDRLVVLPVSRIEDGDRTRESRFLSEALVKRNQWWGDILTALNLVVAEIRRSGVADRGGFRMEDWAALGKTMARTLSQEDIWEKALKEVVVRQAGILLDEDVIMLAIEAWLMSAHYTPTPQLTRLLYTSAKLALFGMDRPDSNWPSSVRSFGRRLAGMQRELQAHLAKKGIQMRWSTRDGNTTYEFLRWE